LFEKAAVMQSSEATVPAGCEEELNKEVLLHTLRCFP